MWWVAACETGVLPVGSARTYRAAWDLIPCHTGCHPAVLAQRGAHALEDVAQPLRGRHHGARLARAAARRAAAMLSPRGTTACVRGPFACDRFRRTGGTGPVKPSTTCVATQHGAGETQHDTQCCNPARGRVRPITTCCNAVTAHSIVSNEWMGRPNSFELFAHRRR
jgi:hypothetical protein